MEYTLYLYIYTHIHLHNTWQYLIDVCLHGVSPFTLCNCIHVHVCVNPILVGHTYMSTLTNESYYVMYIGLCLSVNSYLGFYTCSIYLEVVLDTSLPIPLIQLTLTQHSGKG